MTTTKQVETPISTMPPIDATQDLSGKVKFNVPTDEDMNVLSSMRSNSSPWKERGEKTQDSLEAMTKLRPFIQVGKIEAAVVGYVTIERDGPVPGAAYMRNVVVKPELKKRTVGQQLLNQALQVARDMNRKTLALRVDPANGPAVSFFRKHGFTTVTTMTSKKSGKLRLIMSREL